VPTEPVVLDAGWIEAARLLSAEAGWNQTAADWSVFLTRGTVLGVIAEDRLLATAAVLPYGDAFGWISMVLVTPAWRGRGIATRLVADCVALLRDAGRAAFLDATPAGATVYARIGFAALCEMQRWQGPGGGLSTPGGAVDLSADRAAFGADRRSLLEDFLARSGSQGVAGQDGFAILRRGAGATQLGPIVGDPGEAQGLLRAGIQAATGRLFVDVLEAGFALAPVLSACGFTVQRSYIRMSLGGGSLPGNPARMPVAAGPEYG
jgi:GNAT superfamily N-acetyltransferase